MYGSSFNEDIRTEEEDEEERVEDYVPPIGCGKELVSQFEKLLRVSSSSDGGGGGGNKLINRGQAAKESSLHRLQTGWRKKRSKKPKKATATPPILRPSKLNFLRKSSSKGCDFSFETCSKELESIISSGQRRPRDKSRIRPRSSSLPSSSSSPRKSTLTRPRNTLAKNAADNINEKSGRTKENDKSRHHHSSTKSCAQQARRNELRLDMERLADYLEESILLPKKMSYMAEMMYT